MVCLHVIIDLPIKNFLSYGSLLTIFQYVYCENFQIHLHAVVCRFERTNLDPHFFILKPFHTFLRVCNQHM